VEASDETESSADERYDAVSCPACGKPHFVNRKTGKLLGHEKEDRHPWRPSR
jgi:hypothetical protein